MALLATVLAAVGTTHVVAGHSVPNLAAYHAAFLTAAGLALVGSAVALTIKDADAAATMVRPGKPARSGSDDRPVPATGGRPDPAHVPHRLPTSRSSRPRRRFATTAAV